MDAKSKRPTVRGRAAQVDICPGDVGLVLSVGSVALWLELGLAEDIVETLTRALSVAVGRDRGEGTLVAPESN